MNDTKKRFPDTAVLRAFQTLIPQHWSYLNHGSVSLNDHALFKVLIGRFNEDGGKDAAIFRMPPRPPADATSDIRESMQKARSLVFADYLEEAQNAAEFYI